MRILAISSQNVVPAHTLNLQSPGNAFEMVQNIKEAIKMLGKELGLPVADRFRVVLVGSGSRWDHQTNPTDITVYVKIIEELGFSTEIVHNECILNDWLHAKDRAFKELVSAA
jgi:hypothetical protein